METTWQYVCFRRAAEDIVENGSAASWTRPASLKGFVEQSNPAARDLPPPDHCMREKNFDLTKKKRMMSS